MHLLGTWSTEPFSAYALAGPGSTNLHLSANLGGGPSNGTFTSGSVSQSHVGKSCQQGNRRCGRGYHSPEIKMILSCSLSESGVGC